jgi:hypothetical protein
MAMEIVRNVVAFIAYAVVALMTLEFICLFYRPQWFKKWLGKADGVSSGGDSGWFSGGGDCGGGDGCH